MEIIYIIASVIVGLVVGYEVRKNTVNRKTKKAEENAEKILEDANTQKKEILLNAKDESLKIITQAKQRTV